MLLVVVKLDCTVRGIVGELRTISGRCKHRLEIQQSPFFTVVGAVRDVPTFFISFLVLPTVLWSTLITAQRNASVMSHPPFVIPLERRAFHY